MLWRALVNPNLSSTDKVIYALSLAERKNWTCPVFVERLGVGSV
jgi:hypothetical protein